MSSVMVDRKRLKEILAKPLLHGAHSPDGEMCVMEAVAYVAGEKWSDHPKCASLLLTSFCISWNDAMNDEDRQILKPFIPRLVNTVASKEVELKRSWMALNWYCRVSAPAWLDLAGLKVEAKAIRATAPIMDSKTAMAAQKVLGMARSAAAAAGAAAWAALRPTVVALQKSALKLLDAMIAVSE